MYYPKSNQKVSNFRNLLDLLDLLGALGPFFSQTQIDTMCQNVMTTLNKLDNKDNNHYISIASLYDNAVRYNRPNYSLNEIQYALNIDIFQKNRAFFIKHTN